VREFRAKGNGDVEEAVFMSKLVAYTSGELVVYLLSLIFHNSMRRS